MSDVPRLSWVSPDGSARAIVVVLPGGREHGYRPVRRTSLVVVRMWPFVQSLHRRTPASAVGLVRYRHRGWNGADPLADAAFGVAAMQEKFGPVPVVLVGHSMGGRTALRSAGLPHVTAVVGLAPWVPAGEPVDQLAGRKVLLLHGSNDRSTNPDATARFAARAAEAGSEVVSLRLSKTGHPMLRRSSVWHRLTADFVASALAGSSLVDFAATEPDVDRNG